MKIEPQDLERVRVFPRAQWRRVANGSFLLKDIVKRIKTKPFRGRTRDFIAKVQALSYRLRNQDDNSAVLLIGVDDAESGDRAGRQSPLDGGVAGFAGGVAGPLPRLLRLLAFDVEVVLVSDKRSEPLALRPKSAAQSLLRRRCGCGAADETGTRDGGHCGAASVDAGRRYQNKFQVPRAKLEKKFAWESC